MVVENHKLPRFSASLTIDNVPQVQGDKKGIESLTASLLGNGSKNIEKDTFNEEVDFLGARMSFGDESAFVGGLSKYFPRLIELMADAALHPNFTQEEFDKEKTKLIEGLKSDENSVPAATRRVRNLLGYGANHPYGEYTSEASVNNVTLQDVKNHYTDFFAPDNAYLVIVGDVSFKKVKKLVTKYFINWKRGQAPNLSFGKPTNVQYQQIDFVDMPNAVQSELSIISTVDFEMTDPDYHAVLIANKILGGGFNSMLNLNLREEHGYTYGARSSLRYQKYAPSMFIASTSVRNDVTAEAVKETLLEIENIRTKNVTEEQLKNAKAKYVGDFVLALERPQTIASYALNIKRNNLPATFYETYLEQINKVTVADVKRVANLYFSLKNVRIVIGGKGSDVIGDLEKIKIPINYYDAYGNPIKKPVFSKPIPEGITAQSVINTYLAAVGGKDNLQLVTSIAMSGTTNIDGVPMSLAYSLKRMSPNKEMATLTAEGMGTLSKSVFDGTTGYEEQRGQKQVLSPDAIAEKKNQHVIFPELHYTLDSISLESLTTIAGEEAYKIKVTENDKETYRYYNAASGFLQQIETVSEQGGQKVTTVLGYENYTPVNSYDAGNTVRNIQIPFSQTMKNSAGERTINITTLVKSVTINEGVSEADFK
jgi:predicted Zn-dependent peptidase